jgi:serine/threonine-protein kinase
MGAVHRVRDRHLLREVAIKVLSPELAGDPKYVRRFFAEAQIQAQLDHPNIVPVHDLSLDHKGTSYFTMRLVHGRSLADWITEAHLSRNPSKIIHDLLGAFLKICDAVAFAHSRGVLHLDIKPENVVMEEFGTVYLMDWGLARLIDRNSNGDEVVAISPEAAGGAVSGVVGSPSYMSPEQATGSMGSLSERTDVFGLGAVLYAILAGHAPYLADSVEEVLQQARAVQMPALAEVPLGLPFLAAVGETTRKAMALDPRQRHQSALELKREVEEALRAGLALSVEQQARGATEPGGARLAASVELQDPGRASWLERDRPV